MMANHGGAKRKPSRRMLGMKVTRSLRRNRKGQFVKQRGKVRCGSGRHWMKAGSGRCVECKREYNRDYYLSQQK